MARRRVGFTVNRPGRRVEDPPVEIPVAKDLESVPGTPIRDNEITYYAREYPLESVAVEHSASSLWALDVREEAAPETAELYRQHQEEIGPIVEWLKSTGDMETTEEPTGNDVTEAIRARARELGYGEVGFTNFDRRFAYKSKRQYIKGDLRNAICLAVEQDYVATQSLPSIEAESAHGDTHLQQAEMAKELVDYIHSLGYRTQVWGPTWHFGAMIPLFVKAGLGTARNQWTVAFTALRVEGEAPNHHHQRYGHTRQTGGLRCHQVLRDMPDMLHALPRSRHQPEQDLV